MRKRTSLLLALVLGITAATLAPGGAAALRCIENPPPQCYFDPVCLEACAALHPHDAEARCQCGLGCCAPIDPIEQIEET